MVNKTVERRKYPRVEKSLPLKISREDLDIITETKNISCSGAYCQIDKYLPLMSKVEIVLLLPIESHNKKIITKKIKCIGVVVRSEPVILKGVDSAYHNVAIFFTELNKADRNTIAQYINCNLIKSQSLE